MDAKEIQESLDRLIHGKEKDLSAYLLEVCGEDIVDHTKATLSIHMLRLDGNNRPRIKDFVNFVTDCMIDYCIPPKNIREALEKDAINHTTTNIMKLRRKAKSLFTDLSNTGEGGEMILSIMAQRILGMPQVLCKMPLKTNPNVHYHGADGLYGKYDSNSNKFYLYWGESKLYADVGKAMSDCFDSIKKLLIDEDGEGVERDLELFRDNLDFDNEKLENAIVAYLDPDNEENLSLEYRGICLIGYDEDVYPKDLSGVELVIKNAISQKIDIFKKKISDRLDSRTPLDQIVIKVLLVPFPSVEEFRKKFLEEK